MVICSSDESYHFFTYFIRCTFFVSPHYWNLLIIIFIKSALSSAFGPARQGIIHEVVPKEFLAEASSLSQMVLNATKIGAPAVGGTLLTIVKLETIFVIECLFFFVSLLFMIKFPKLIDEEIRSNENNKNSYWKEFKAGFLFIKSSYLLFSAITMVSISMFIIYLYDSFFAPLSQNLGLDKTGYGLISSSLGAGSVIGSILSGVFSRWKKNPLLYMTFGRIISGFLLLVVGFGCYGFAKENLFFWMVMFFVIGCIGTALFIPLGYILQIETPQHMMGRMSAFSTAVQSIASLLAPIIGAFIGNLFGLGSIFIGASGLFIILGLISLIFLKYKRQMSILEEVKDVSMS
ncbi:MFS transporter [Bacillus sp. RG28]|uniref:MFS transporter n=1 Tax=Gottfriedia endophytica TaxID=2820819 RepID=A0A940NLB0_9BACI|nr:MFS transporter [Gottfriedia endophytica]MBP0726550.1 MFS transporter [Gottfriedia endophytica]